MLLGYLEAEEQSGISNGRVVLCESISDEAFDSSKMGFRVNDASEGTEGVGAEERDLRVDILGKRADDDEGFVLLGI